ncbi:hypothetical protein EYF80_029819 [Liparis tanakae]|uniref:Uncharacterized protein n=1 Tax=Liparis tanakae TaxID=230148 RepID=A0A4Z2H263_9TELE|nr:hypothetical protein EYF80_029819 [Liparis tanakae]
MAPGEKDQNVTYPNLLERSIKIYSTPLPLHAPTQNIAFKTMGLAGALVPLKPVQVLRDTQEEVGMGTWGLAAGYSLRRYPRTSGSGRCLRVVSGRRHHGPASPPVPLASAPFCKQLWLRQLKSSHLMVGEFSVLEPPGDILRRLHTTEYTPESLESTDFSEWDVSIQVEAGGALSSGSLSFVAPSWSSGKAGGLGRGDQGRPVVIFRWYELLVPQPAAMEAKAESGSSLLEPGWTGGTNQRWAEAAALTSSLCGDRRLLVWGTARSLA